jgi:hypothetical protein
VRVRYRIDTEQVLDRCAVLQLHAISCNEMYGQVMSCYVMIFHIMLLIVESVIEPPACVRGKWP